MVISIPHYKNGKRLYFKRDEINEWIFTTKVNTAYNIDKAANKYIKKTSKKIVFTIFSIEINKNSVFYWKIFAKK
jgi:hypothetical protein